MSIVGETLACRQKSRNVQDRYAVAVVRTDTETETDTGSSATTAGHLPRKIYCLCSLSSSWRYHRQAGRRTRVLGGMATQILMLQRNFRKFNFRHREPLRKLEPYENYRLYGSRVQCMVA